MKIKKNSNGSIQDANLVGILNKCHVFRDLFDFVTESELENTLQNELKSTADDFDESKIETISNIISQSKIDWNKFSIPPYKFSHINLPLSFRDIRLNLKVLLLFYCFYIILMFRFLKKMNHLIKSDLGIFHLMSRKYQVILLMIVYPVPKIFHENTLKLLRK